DLSTRISNYFLSTQAGISGGAASPPRQLGHREGEAWLGHLPWCPGPPFSSRLTAAEALETHDDVLGPALGFPGCVRRILLQQHYLIDHLRKDAFTQQHAGPR